MVLTALGMKFYLEFHKGSIQWLLLFNIFIRDTFYSMEDFEITNYADDSTPFSAKLNHKSVVEELKISSSV